jgi:protein-tyrosine phosphatase
VVCTANRCRSVMAGALLACRLAEIGVTAVVRSAGSLGQDQPAPPEVISAMAAHGLDVGRHRSHVMTTTDLSAADLVLAMAREHVRHAVVTDPAAWSRTFTLKELLRRGRQTGPRMGGEPLAEWLARVHAGRQRAALLGDSPDDDVADPIGGPPQAYRATADLLDQLTGDLVELCWGLTAGG